MWPAVVAKPMETRRRTGSVVKMPALMSFGASMKGSRSVPPMLALAKQWSTRPYLAIDLGYRFLPSAAATADVEHRRLGLAALFGDGSELRGVRPPLVPAHQDRHGAACCCKAWGVAQASLRHCCGRGRPRRGPTGSNMFMDSRPLMFPQNPAERRCPRQLADVPWTGAAKKFKMGALFRGFCAHDFHHTNPAQRNAKRKRCTSNTANCSTSTRIRATL